MPDGRAPALLEALGLERRRCACLIGGGGKTTLMFTAAGALVAAGRTVLTTTTTRILWPGPDESACVVSGCGAAELTARLRAAFDGRPHVTAVAPDPDQVGKVAGLAPEVLEALVAARLADHVLVEADGSAGRPLKAHLPHEPVVPPCTDLVIAVVGASCVGTPMDDAHVHRAALMRERLGRPAGASVTAADVAGILLHPQGWLERVDGTCEVIVLVNQADTPARRAAAHDVAVALRARDPAGRLARVVVGDVRRGSFERVG